MTKASTHSQPTNSSKALESKSAYHTEARFEQIKAFIAKALDSDGFKIESLAGDASFRRYHRVSFELESKNDINSTSEILNLQSGNLYKCHLVMDAPPQIESIESFVRIGLLLATKVNVPTIYSKDIRKGFLLLQDFGDVEFADMVSDALVNDDLERIDELYHLAMDHLLDLQQISIDLAKFSFGVQNYTDALLQKEMDLFKEWFIPHLNIRFNEEDEKVWQQFCMLLINDISNQPKSVVHRDFHSRNLMQDQFEPDTLGIIDFQDAVIGSYAYDLVSLLRDAYVDWSEEQIEAWMEYFWKQLEVRKLYSPILPNLKQFKEHVNIMGIQRHLKILGIFIRLSKRDGKNRYIKFIPKVWRDLNAELDWLKLNGSASVQQYVVPFSEWLNERVLLNYESTLLDTL